MKTLHIFSFLILFSLISNEAISQDKNNDKIEEYKELQKTLEGYYQIQVINSRALPTISYDLLKKIESKRSKNGSSYITIREDIRVLVLGKTASPIYLKENEKLVYINE